MKTNIFFEFYNSKDFEPNMAQLRLRCLLPFLYMYSWDYVTTGDSVMLTSKSLEVPKCSHEWYYFLNILPQELKWRFTDDVSDLVWLYLEPELLEFLKKYFATSWSLLNENQKFALCGKDKWSLIFIELIAKYISQFKFHYAVDGPLFLQIPGNFAREVLEKIPPSPKLTAELVKRNAHIWDVVRNKIPPV
jgi:hypothetical protein